MTTPRTPTSPAVAASAERRGLFALIADVPKLMGDLVRAEIASLKAELGEKLKAAGAGAGLLAGAGVVAFFAAMVLIAAAVLALALVLPAWASALIIGVLLLIVAGIIAAIGVRALKRGMPPTPTGTLESVQEDVRAVRGLRK